MSTTLILLLMAVVVRAPHTSKNTAHTTCGILIFLAVADAWTPIALKFWGA